METKDINTLNVSQVVNDGDNLLLQTSAGWVRVPVIRIYDSLGAASLNLLNGSAFSQTGWGLLRAESEPAAGAMKIRVTSGSADGAIYRDFDIQEAFIGKNVTFSVSVSTDWGINYFLSARSVNSDGSLANESKTKSILAPNPTRGQLSGLTVKPLTAKLRLYVYTASRQYLTIHDGFMLSEGISSARWMPSNADMLSKFTPPN